MLFLGLYGVVNSLLVNAVVVSVLDNRIAGGESEGQRRKHHGGHKFNSAHFDLN